MKVRALVIDDSKVMRNMVMMSLQRTNLAEFEFTEAEDGADGVAKFNPKNIDICFVDWNMPNLSGIDFVRKIRRTYKDCDVPMVMVTSEKTVAKIEEALDKAGANAYVTKPFTDDYFIRKIGPIIEQMAAKQVDKPAASAGGGGFFSKLRKAG